MEKQGSMSEIGLYTVFYLLMNPDLLRNKIKQILKEKNLSVRKAEQLSGISPTVLSFFLSGRNQDLKIETVSLLAKAIDISLSELLEISMQDLESSQLLPWNGEVLSELCDILKNLLVDKKVQLNNLQIFPILIEVYYTCTKEEKAIDKNLVRLLFKKSLEKYF